MRRYALYRVPVLVFSATMRTAFTGNMAEEVFNVLIVSRRFVLLLLLKASVQAPFRHRYHFKSTALAPVSEKSQTIPIAKQGGVCGFGGREFPHC